MVLKVPLQDYDPLYGGFKTDCFKIKLCLLDNHNGSVGSNHSEPSAIMQTQFEIVRLILHTVFEQQLKMT